MPPPGKIMYCAFPTRLRHLREAVKARARLMGYAPVVPFDCGDFEDFEGNPRIGRTRTLEFDIGIMRACDVVGVFGISAGVMGEIRAALENQMEVRAVCGLDPEWDKYYRQLRAEYGDVFKRLRGRHSLFALIGPTAIGKTFWSNFLIDRYPGRLQRVKNTTTRPPRDDADYASYNFVSRAGFEQGVAEFQFLEHDEYLGHLYGSSLDEIRRLLKSSSGIFAITPAGASALFSYRFEINLVNILLRPVSPEVLLNNLHRRGVTDPTRCAELVEAAARFTLPSTVKHDTVWITGHRAAAEKQMLAIIEKRISP